MSINPTDFDDVGEAIRENRPLHPSNSYRIRFAVDSTSFSNIEVTDPIPTGRQILSSANLDDRDGYFLYAILESGDFEEIRLNETFDLRGRGAERFIAFKTDRDFKFTLNSRQLAWGRADIPGYVLHELANASPDDAVFLEVRGGEDLLIGRDEYFNLDAPGVEHFLIAPRPVKSFIIVVNSREEIVTEKLVTFEQVVKLSHPNAPAEANVKFSMTYRNAVSFPHAGELGEGGSVEVKKQGTIFNVTRTVQS